MPSNLDTQTLTFGVGGTTEVAITHDLGRTPLDGFIINRTSSANVYRGATAWSTTTIYLAASASVTVTLLIF